LERPGFHIFRASLAGRVIDFDPIKTAWTSLSDARIAEYGSMVPSEWAGAAGAVKTALTLIQDARDNIDACLAEVKRVLT
jgi:hypothetical protein